MTESDQHRRDNQRKNRNPVACPVCYGDVWLPSGYLPHAETCPKYRPPAAVLHDPFECSPHPFDEDCEEARRRAMYREGVRLPGLRPRSIPERYELVRPDQREPERPRVRTPDYGHDGLN